MLLHESEKASIRAGAQGDDLLHLQRVLCEELVHRGIDRGGANICACLCCKWSELTGKEEDF